MKGVKLVDISLKIYYNITVNQKEVTIMRKDKWVVYGEYGDSFTNLKDACECAKVASEECGEASVILIKDGCSYIDYENGKKVYDGWKR